MPTKHEKALQATYTQLNDSLFEFTNGRLKHVKKCESLLMKLIEFLLRPFNPHFASYITCLFYTIYWPGEVSNEKNVGREGIAVLAHEGRHMLDKWMTYTYGLPHILALGCFTIFAIIGGWMAFLLLVASCFVLALGLSWCDSEDKKPFLIIVGMVFFWFIMYARSAPLSISIWLLLGFVMASPIPNFLGLSYLRAIAELRGYQMTLLVDYLITGRVSTDLCYRIQKHLTGGDYYYALPWPCLARRLIKKTITRMRQGAWLHSEDRLTAKLVTILEHNKLIHTDCSRTAEIHKKAQRKKSTLFKC